MFNANETFRDAIFLMFFLTLLVCEVGGTMIFRTQFETAVYVKSSFYVPSLYEREREREYATITRAHFHLKILLVVILFLTF